MRHWKTVFIFLSVLLVMPVAAQAVEPAPRISDREIIESLATIKGDIKRLDQRFDAVDQRFDAMEKHLDFNGNLLVAILAGIFSSMGFILWDRRTALAPAIAKNKELEQRIATIEERAIRVESLVKEVAQKDPNVAEALRHARLL